MYHNYFIYLFDLVGVNQLINSLHVANLNCSHSSIDVNQTLVCGIDFNFSCPNDIVVDIIFDNQHLNQIFSPASNKIITLV